MPLTPFHLGPALLVGALAGRHRLDLPALLVGSVIIDVRAALVLFGPLDPPVHGVLTTLAGATLVGFLVAGVAVAAYPRILPTRDRLEHEQSESEPWSGAWPGLRAWPGSLSWSPGPVIAGALVGVWSHVLLDALLYADVVPFAPIDGNPFLGLVSTGMVYGGCLFAGGLAVMVVVVRYGVS